MNWHWEDLLIALTVGGFFIACIVALALGDAT